MMDSGRNEDIVKCKIKFIIISPD